MKVRAYNEWDRLESVLIGIADNIYFPGHHSIEEEATHSLAFRSLKRALYSALEGYRAPGFISNQFQRELNQFSAILKKEKITVLHPKPVQPLPHEAAGLGQMFARDSILTVGETVILGQLQIEMRRKERRGFTKLVEDMILHGIRVERLDYKGAYLEGGDVILDWPHVYVGIGKYGSNAAGAEWLQQVLGSTAQVIPVQILDPGILHLDCCLTLIGAGRGIIHRAALCDPLPAPLDDYDFIEIDARTRLELGGNILMLDPETIVLQSRHSALASVLNQRGYRCMLLPFNWHATLDGAFRCASAPLLRVS